MTENEKAMLIFGAGLSTADTITDISGRGVGMDVVKTNIQKLGGAIKLDTHLGEGNNNNNYATFDTCYFRWIRY